MTILKLMVLVFSIYVAALFIVAIDPEKRPLAKELLEDMWPQFWYGLLSIVILSWLIYRDFEPLGGLGSELMHEAMWRSNGGGSPFAFLKAWLGAPIMGLLDYILLFLLFGAVVVLWVLFCAELFVQSELVKNVFVNAWKVVWSWREYPIRLVQFIVDLFTHPPSVKEIGETLRSTLPEEEKIRNVSTALRNEYEEVLKKKISGWRMASFGRQHKAFADELAARTAKAKATYHRGIAETARSLREAAEEGEKMRVGGERDESK